MSSREVVKMFKSEDNIIKFISLPPGLEERKEILPRKYKNFLPDWWTNIPNSSEEIKTVRNCPGISDLFSNIYVVPMWQNTSITFLPKEEISVTYEEDAFAFPEWSLHPNSQMIDHAEVFMGDRQVTHTLKIVSPWAIVTPKGYSVLQIPLFYSMNPDYTPMAGIVDTDIFHESNIPTMLHSNNEMIYFKKGTPLVGYIPFKREKFQETVMGYDKEVFDLLIQHGETFVDGIAEGNSYRKMQKGNI
jgi:hypothetical protein